MPGPGNVGERVRNLRLTRRLSQAQLAGHDLSDSYISLIESGKRTPTPTVLRMLAERLGCTPEYLAEGVEPEQRAHLEVRERHAHLALLRGDAATAEAGFDEVIARSDDPDLTSRARWGRARALEELGRTDAAIALFEELREQAERDPGRASWLPPVIALARCYHTVGDLGQAIALGERAVERLEQLGLGVGNEFTEAGRILLLAYVDRSDPARAHDLGRRLLHPDDSAEAEPVSVHYQRASMRALEEGTVGDSLYFADQALTARTDATPVQSQARLALAGAKALLRGVLPFSVVAAPGAMPSGEFGVERPRAEGSREAAQEALALLQATGDLEGDEFTESTIAKARALVLMGELDDAIATLEQFLNTGLALAPPTSTHSVTPQPGSDLAVRTQKSVLARLVLARARVAQGDHTAAQVVLRAASEQLAMLASGRPAAHLYRELGELFELVQDSESAATAYRQALQAAGLSASQLMSASGARAPSFHGQHDDPAL
ncbi:helix-turn-helix transcriptional regulator [Actinomadura geliboluensis]|uniref:Helix-turn-helix transcriptional regulator n=1 Tax=Actinomadura geliboluensis TaxID=882440 RepID=A0A5S4G4S0_9ACTN|nr:helix-turn-helix transcriptional regulator [Actinomadura geliboluensis]TMR27842.1 helix-turn-helix transcriptional regulator [Actinomadura geliboluensis]